MENINDIYFDGLYKEIWRNTNSESLTRAEVEFLIESCQLGSEHKVLDLMCGYGRHALELAKKGILVTAVDNLLDYTKEIESKAKLNNLPVTVFHKDVFLFQTVDKFDLVVCLGNSVSFFSPIEIGRLFSMIESVLKPGGKFIFNSLMIAEIAIKQFIAKTWSYVGNIKFLADSQYLFSPSRIETDSIFITADGKTETKKGIDYIYSLNETESILNDSGLSIQEKWSIPGKKKFTVGEPRIYVVAEKR